MFKEVLENEPKENEFDEKVHKYGYITIVRLEAGTSKQIIARIPKANFGNPANNNCNSIDNLFFWFICSTVVALDNSTTWIT